ncbi:MAG: hypothetical protein KAH72_10575 [Flavobacteriaceae bacterium]|nr:hypothetical protein [Flavobacteriaceae bacterium]
MAQARPDQTGSHTIVAAQKTVVRLVSIIGANLTYHAFKSASFKVKPFFFSTFI